MNFSQNEKVIMPGSFLDNKRSIQNVSQESFEDVTKNDKLRFQETKEQEVNFGKLSDYECK